MRPSGRGFPGVIAKRPLCILSARTVATMRAASGSRPEARHLMSKNFSAPMSAPKPASVTTMSAVRRAMRSAMMELFPCAIFAKGPVCTMAGVPSRVCIRVGLRASLRTAAMAPATLRSSAVTGVPVDVYATTMVPKRLRRSLRSVASPRIAMISLADVMSNPLLWGVPFFSPPRATSMWRSARSLTSMTRRHVTRSTSMSSSLPWKMLASKNAEHRLWADVIA